MDYAIVIYLNQLAAASPPLSGVVVFFAQYFPYLVGGLFVVFILTRPVPQKEKWFALAEGFGAALVARFGFVELIRTFVHRQRPFLDHAVTALLSERSFSFPSGHAAFFFALSTVVFLHDRKWGWWFYAASFVIGLARVAAGVHFPTDILSGAVLGIAVGYVVIQAGRFFLKAR